jgi:hypothetical protein
MSVCLSVCPPVYPHRITRLPLSGFSRNFIFEHFYETCGKKFKFHWNLKIINRYITPRPIHIYENVLSSSSQNEKYFRQSCRENKKSHFVFSNTPGKSCRLWDNMWKYGTAVRAVGGNIMRRLRFSCWVTKPTETHSEYVLLTAFPRQRWFRERALLLPLYLHTLPVSFLLHSIMAPHVDKSVFFIIKCIKLVNLWLFNNRL